MNERDAGFSLSFLLSLFSSLLWQYYPFFISRYSGYLPRRQFCKVHFAPVDWTFDGTGRALLRLRHQAPQLHLPLYPRLSPTFVLDEPESEPDVLDELVTLLPLAFAPPSEFPSVVVVFSAIIVSRSEWIQPFWGAFLAEPPVFLLGD